MSACDFSPESARGKRPFPMWVDSFLRDTMELNAEEIGAYHLILYAMWKRKDCTLSNDPKRLTQIACVSTRLWKSRISASLMPLFEITEGGITSKKLKIEAQKTEKFCLAQHVRNCPACKSKGTYGSHSGNPKAPQENHDKDEDKNAENPDNLLNSNKPYPTTGITAEAPTDSATESTADQTTAEPIQYSKIYGGGGSACARTREAEPIPPPTAEHTEREILLQAIGADPVSGLVGPNGQIIARLADMQEFRRWREELGLDLPEIVDVIRDVMNHKPDGPPAAFTYFTQPMQRFAARKAQTPLRPSEGVQNGHPTDATPRSDRYQNPASRAHQNLIAAFARAVPEEC